MMIYEDFEIVERDTFLDKYGLISAVARVRGENNSRYRQRLINYSSKVANSTRDGIENVKKISLYSEPSDKYQRFLYLKYRPYANIHVYKYENGSQVELKYVECTDFLKGKGDCTVWKNNLDEYTNVLELRFPYDEVMVEYDFINDLNAVDHYSEAFKCKI